MGKVVNIKKDEDLAQEIDKFELEHFKSLIEEKKNLELSVKAVEVSLAKHFQFCAKKYSLTNEKDSINVDNGEIIRFQEEVSVEPDATS